MTNSDDRTLAHLLDGLDYAATGKVVSVRDVLNEFGNRAITPFILLVALILVTPLSGIPGAPSVGALIIILLSFQALSGRQKLWLPDVILRQDIAAHRLRSAVNWMRRPSAFLDRHSRERLQFLTVGPMRWITLTVCVVVPSAWPLLELLPLTTSVGAATIAFFAFGLFTRDGLFVLFGYLLVCMTLGAALVFFIQVVP
jgi:hypothetical protein